MRTRLSSPPTGAMTGAIYRKRAGRVRWYLPTVVLNTGTKYEHSLESAHREYFFSPSSLSSEGAEPKRAVVGNERIALLTHAGLRVACLHLWWVGVAHHLSYVLYCASSSSIQLHPHHPPCVPIPITRCWMFTSRTNCCWRSITIIISAHTTFSLESCELLSFHWPSSRLRRVYLGGRL